MTVKVPGKSKLVLVVEDEQEPLMPDQIFNDSKDAVPE
jgi:hypothetical protein